MATITPKRHHIEGTKYTTPTTTTSIVGNSLQRARGGGVHWRRRTVSSVFARAELHESRPQPEVSNHKRGAQERKDERHGVGRLTPCWRCGRGGRKDVTARAGAGAIVAPGQTCP